MRDRRWPQASAKTAGTGPQTETSARVCRFAAMHSRTTDRLAARVVWGGRRLQEHLT